MSKLYVGIDICKEYLDVFITNNNYKRFNNNKEGHKLLNKFLNKFIPELIVMEATGNLHKAVWRSLYNNGFKVFIVNPRRSRLFAGSTGCLAKTDKVDAKILAKFGEVLNPNATSIPSALEENLQEILTSRIQITNEITKVNNMISSHSNKQVISLFKKQICLFKKQIIDIDEKLLELIEDNEELNNKYKILLSIKGIGKLNAIMLISYLPELGNCSSKEISSLVGVVPFNKDSGNTNGKRTISGGRKCIRNMLYMGAVSAKSYNRDMKLFYERLIQKGKPSKVALTAVIRKMIIVANTLIKENRVWRENY